MRRFLTSIRLDPAQMDGLTEISQRDRRTTAWLIREAVDQFLKRDAIRRSDPAAKEKTK
jgi:predicted transcriptional regulator